ncbi:DUF3577 domain-containing protein [Citrobacter sp. S2-9]|uniref:DUF3577 domain-containing protein n=1 Tax=Citrobacter enshiensis TaxID=2971264 RepID=A0ABT8PVA1_9ENTR|nr:DUF3577 domain-containing protein [Citrobacter enshiensis]MDN8600285.1 DUF3577 domain-containing protein [Citrobacter enshiensis]
MSTFSEKKYFDLHTRGIGYVNRLRTVTPKKAKPFLACTIAALRGSADEPEYTYIDVRVCNEKACELLESCQDALGQKQKVLIAFTVGDIYPECFTYEHGEKKGQCGCGIKGRLIKITLIKINGHEVYRENAAENLSADA